jgi:hypothetical protein
MKLDPLPWLLASQAKIHAENVPFSVVYKAN